MKTVEVHVTAEHMAKGAPGVCCRCPLALAIGDAIPALAEVYVYTRDVELIPIDREHVQVELPPEAVQCVHAIDHRVHGIPDPDPFTFTLQIPDEVAA